MSHLCKNKSCKSYGKEHPNCKCYNQNSMNSVTDGQWCYTTRQHAIDCEFYISPRKPIVYLICGVPGSGKTWVCEQLRDDFIYVPHDIYFTEYLPDVMLRHVEEYGDRRQAYVTECPFGERIAREQLEAAGFEVRPFFVIEEPDVVAQRYSKREGKPATQATRDSRLTVGST